MPGDRWQQLAGLRLLLGYQYATPGKKLLFMGAELAQEGEWNHEGSVEWDLAQLPEHAGVTRLLTDLNHLYREEPALHRNDFDPAGFQWVDAGDADQSVLSWLRSEGRRTVLAVCNFTPVPRTGYRLGVPGRAAFWREMVNSDAPEYGGSGQCNFGGVEAEPEPWHGRPWSVSLTVPPLGVMLLRSEPSRLSG
jgi:1,4-alpha-glucan branching enzyme